MESRIILTDNKHLYARVEGGVLEVRVPRWLPVHQREELVERLLRKTMRRYKGPGLFAQIRASGEVHWAWGEVWPLDARHLALPEKEFRRWLLEEARIRWKDQVHAELRGFAVQMGVKRPLRRVGIRDLRSRWGSCSAEGDIAISLATLLLPYPLFAYVCAHEVAHLTHLSHAPAFWRHLETVMPDAVARRRELHTHHIS